MYSLLFSPTDISCENYSFPQTHTHKYYRVMVKNKKKSVRKGKTFSIVHSLKFIASFLVVTVLAAIESERREYEVDRVIVYGLFLV